MSPAKVRGKFVKGNWLPRWEVSWKLTSDLGTMSANRELLHLEAVDKHPNIAWKNIRANTMRRVTGYLAGKSRGNLPSILVPRASISVRFVRCCKTQMSPAKVREKIVKGNWLPRWEVSWKLTIDLGSRSTEFRQVREVLQNADVACDGAGGNREG